VLILAGSGGASYFAFPNYWHPNPADHFRMQSVTEGDIISVVNSTGTVQPVLSVQIGSFVSGPIKTADVDFNSRVKEGDILARIDPRTYEANVARDEAALSFRVADKERVAALLEQAQHNEQRAQALRKTKSTFISDAEIDQFLAERKSFDAQLKVAAASVKEAEAALSLSKANLGYTVIKSPVDGVVIDRKVDPGQTVAAAF
jgi:HlyD family secretion protein